MDQEQEQIAVNDVRLLRELVDRMWEKKTQVKAAKAALDAEQEVLSELEHQVKRILEAAELDRFDGTNCSVSVRTKTSVRVPKTLEEKQAFFDYLTEKGLFDDMVSVNSKTLNSWYSKEREAYLDGDFLGEFKVPGLNEVSEYTEISVRSKG